MTTENDSDVAETSASHAKAPTSKSKGTVVVASTVALELQLCTEGVFWEDTPTGAKERKKFVKNGEVVRITGPAYPINPAANFRRPRPQVVGQYALTQNVSAEFWNAWVEQNKLSSVVVTNQIFAERTVDGVVAKIADIGKGVRSGLEPLNPDNDPRMPRSFNSGISGIETADEMKQRQSFQQAQSIAG